MSLCGHDEFLYQVLGEVVADNSTLIEQVKFNTRYAVYEIPSRPIGRIILIYLQPFPKFAMETDALPSNSDVRWNTPRGRRQS
mmetsp:Transcript_9275/g.21032  ORF Transcript_9275/g.21032 Transcript_9275/m.21032 type:complete len:83 (-) Transcript_9275:167-415(-)